jgi:hypothetical protein
MVLMPPAFRLPRSIGTAETVAKYTINSGEVIMEIAIAFGAFVGVFVLGAAIILWFPYDKNVGLRDR